MNIMNTIDTMTIESMLITIRTQREYLTELAEEKKKLIRENERLSAELAFNSNSLEKIRKNHINDLIRHMEINIKLESKINDVNKQNELLIYEKEQLSKELSNEKRKHAETTYYYEGRYYDGKCICVKDEYICPHCRIEGSESKDFTVITEQNDENKIDDIERIVNRIDDDDDEDHDDDEDNIIECTNTIEIDDTVIYYDFHDEKLPLIERIDRCLNNTIIEDRDDSNLFTNCYDDNSITRRLLNKYEDNYNHKKNDDNIFDDEFDYIMANGKNEYVDNYFSNRL